MIAVRRLLAVGSVLTLIALLASSPLWGQPKEREKTMLDSTKVNRPSEGAPYAHVAQEMAQSRFAEQPVVLYRTAQGETLMAVQVKPRLEAVPARPCDYLILIDTAAHMAGGDLKTALGLTKKFVSKLGADDQVALWTVNTRYHDLTKGFQPAAKIAPFFKKLDDEFPAGAVNLRDSLPNAIASFDGKADRQRVILFLGSGQSIAGPIDADLRASLCKDMTAKQIAFFSVPLGNQLGPYNVHGFANFTGGKVVRYNVGSTPDKWVVSLLEAVAQPILYGSQIKLPEKIAEVLPTQLPPLRPDVPTLIVGKFAAALTKDDVRFDYTLAGKVGDKDVSVRVSEKMPKPEDENFFLVNMVEQWKAQKERPSLLQADRALSYAFENDQMARADLIAQAEWALEKKKFDVADRLYRQALKVDPTSERAQLGLKFVEALRNGGKNIDQIKEYLKDAESLKEYVKNAKVGHAHRIDEQGNVVKLPAEQLFADPPEKKDNPLAPDQPDPNRINDIRARQEIADQEQRQIVNDAIRQANRQVLSDPDGARDFLKRTLDGVRTNPDITNGAKARLSDQMERALQNVDIRGAVVKRDQEEAVRLLANANARTTLGAQERLEQNRVRERMRVYHNLMDQARELQAYRHAQSIRRDLIDQGLPVPPAVTAAYDVGLAGFHLREIRELRRIRQEKWLAVLLEVERSHIPFPDEPPVEFPPAATWKALSEFRKSRYESTTFGSDLPIEGIELRRRLGQRVNFEGIEDARATLDDALQALAKRYNLTFDVNEKAFEMEGLKEVGRTEIAQPTPIPAMSTTLSTVLRKILRRVPAPSGTTYLIRRDVIEITTGTFASAEKTVRVYPVADLVMPIPNAVNFQQLMGSATLFGLSAGALGGFAGIGGLGGLGAMGMGGLGAMGLGGIAGIAGLGGGLGGLGGLGNVGGLGGVGGIAGLGGQGFNQLGQQGGFQGNFQGQGNLGQGGVVGFGGQQLGQFGNLGGQFGLQGGNTSQILITLIRQVVGRPRDWAINFDPVTGQPLNPLDDNAAAPEGLNQENNQLGFYPPAMALAVKASSTIHTRPSNLIINPNMAQAALPGGRGDAVAKNGKRDPNVKVAGRGDERPDDKDGNKGPPLDPRIVWQDALAKSVDNPGLIIATADFLVLAKKFDHAAEFLKANLRQGVVVEPWVFQSLAIALRLSGGSAEDIERAEVSTADMQPKNAQGYLQAAQALAQDEKYGLALAFCRQAAILEPGTPYAYEEALNYAELARDAKSMEWAAGNLLRHDWPVNNQKLQDRAVQKIEALVKHLNEQGRKEESERLLNSISVQRVRDLVIILSWQGDADLDLRVLEPSGSMCSTLHRQTIGGGVLIGDSLSDMTRETYLAAEAFPGDYEIEIEKVCGHPLAGKAQLRIIRHQGTPDETEQLLTVELKSRHSERIKLKIDAGRRTEAAYVAPPSAHKPPEPSPTLSDGSDKILHKLRLMADPEVTGVGRSFSGGVLSQGQPTLPSRIKSEKSDGKPAPDDRMLYQMRVKPFVQNSMAVTAQAVISADRRYVRLSVAPMFNTVTGMQTVPLVVNPTIPGPR